MEVLEHDPATPLPPPQVAGDLAFGDLAKALGAGWRDFAAMPQYGMFFGGFYVLAGLLIGWAAITGGEPTWLIPAMAGFPLVAPFVCGRPVRGEPQARSAVSRCLGARCLAP